MGRSLIATRREIIAALVSFFLIEPVQAHIAALADAAPHCVAVEGPKGPAPTERSTI